MLDEHLAVPGEAAAALRSGLGGPGPTARSARAGCCLGTQPPERQAHPCLDGGGVGLVVAALDRCVGVRHGFIVLRWLGRQPGTNMVAGRRGEKASRESRTGGCSDCANRNAREGASTASGTWWLEAEQHGLDKKRNAATQIANAANRQAGTTSGWSAIQLRNRYKITALAFR